jgi:hypothetical protein
MAAKGIGVAFSQSQLLAFQQKGARSDLVKSLTKLKSIISESIFELQKLQVRIQVSAHHAG